MVRYLVFPSLAGDRLDVAVAALTGLPRRRARALAEAGRLWLNGRAIHILSRLLRLADVVDVIPGDEALAAPPPPPPPVPILHEDASLVAVDKPAGVATQSPRVRKAGELTVQERLALQLAARDGRRGDVILFHRLDRITSGVLVFARHHEAARALAAAWAAGRADKLYLAVVRGDPGSRPLTVDRPIAADPLVPGRFRADRRGRHAVTEVRRIAQAGGLALIEARPLTGRTHQVRVHLAEAGFPVAGDERYGGGGGVARPYLHAWRLTIPHPATGRRLCLEAPLPSDMRAFLAGAGLLPEGMLDEA